MSPIPGLAEAPPRAEASWSGPSMGGRLDIRIAVPDAEVEAATRAAAMVGGRVAAWANRLTRFTGDSDLARLNVEQGQRLTAVRPTLGAVLTWAHEAAERSAGALDVTLLDARLAAEQPMALDAAEAQRTGSHGPPGATASWSVEVSGRWTIVDRQPGARFDLDGVAKGWIADRAAALLHGWPGALVDADGDIALHVRAGVEWLVGVADPRGLDLPLLATFRIAGDRPWRRSVGVATSGITVHRWAHADGGTAHHLIDPVTRRPAATDLLQATVVAPTAREAEVLAKSAVILGSTAGMALLERSSAQAAILLSKSGDLLSIEGTQAWLA